MHVRVHVVSVYDTTSVIPAYSFSSTGMTCFLSSSSSLISSRVVIISPSTLASILLAYNPNSTSPIDPIALPFPVAVAVVVEEEGSRGEFDGIVEANGVGIEVVGGGRKAPGEAFVLRRYRAAFRKTSCISYTYQFKLLQSVHRGIGIGIERFDSCPL